MKFLKLKLIFAIFLFSLSTGCLHDSNDKHTVTEIEGNWESSCNAVPPFINFYEKSILKVANLTIESIYTTFSDVDCSLPDLSFRFVGSFVIGNELIISSGTTVKELDKKVNLFYATPKSDQLTEKYNNNELCEKSWSKNVEHEITGCNDFEFAISSEHFDIVYIEENTLYLGDGDSGDGSSVEFRPTELHERKFMKM